MSLIVAYCAVPGCEVRIRAMAGELTGQCKWHQQGKATQERNVRTWPYCMPDPALPWPWVTEAERERKVRLAVWQDRFLAHRPLYDRWIINLATDTEEA